MTAIIIPLHAEATLERLESLGFMLVEERRYHVGLVSHKKRWLTRSGELTYEVMPPFLSATLRGELPDWLEPIQFDDLEGVILNQTNIPVAERIEAIAQLGALATLEGGLGPKLFGLFKHLLEQPRAELQLAALHTLEHLPAQRQLSAQLNALAQSGTLLVKPAALKLLAKTTLHAKRP